MNLYEYEGSYCDYDYVVHHVSGQFEAKDWHQAQGRAQAEVVLALGRDDDGVAESDEVTHLRLLRGVESEE